jgi:YesN/AraC family two-component response regulator
VCQRLKANPDTAQVPVIFISALNQVEDKTRAFQQGGVDYITKPFEEAEVLARVQTQITIGRQQRLLAAHNQQLQTEIQHRQDIEARLQSQLIQENCWPRWWSRFTLPGSGPPAARHHRPFAAAPPGRSRGGVPHPRGRQPAL